MITDLEKLKAEVLDIFQAELADAKRDWFWEMELERGEALERIIPQIERVGTLHELFRVLVGRPDAAFSEVGTRLIPLMQLLKKSCNPEVLYSAGLLVDEFPATYLSGIRDVFVLVNTNPSKVNRCRMDMDKTVTFVGSWLVDQFRGNVFAMKGAHVNVWGFWGVKAYPKGGTVVKRLNEYFEPIQICQDSLDYLRMKKIQQEGDSYVLFDTIKETIEKKEEINLAYIREDVRPRREDEVIAEDSQFVLTENRRKKQFYLYRIWPEDRLVDYMEKRLGRYVVGYNLSDLQEWIFLKRFIRFPNGEVPIGTNHLGEPISITYNQTERRFYPKGLYVKNKEGDYVTNRRAIEIDFEHTLEWNVKQIQEKLFSD